MKHIVEEVVLNNGSRGLIIHVPNATVMAYDVEFRAGHEYCLNEDLYEAAHIMEHMVFGANKKFPNARLFNAELVKNGASSNATTDHVSIHYLADCPDFDWERMLDLLRLAITQPLFLPDEYKAEYGNVNEEMMGYRNNYSRVLWQRIARVSGERFLDDGERISRMQNVKLKDIQEHYKRTHTLDNMRFVIAGNIEPDRRKTIISMLEKWDLPAGERFGMVSDELVGSNEPIRIVRKDFENLLFGISIQANWRLPDDERDSMAALNHILTGWLHSLILGRARSMGLAYDIGSVLSRSNSTTEWNFGGEVSLKNAPKLFEIIVEELKAVLAGNISEKDIEAAKSYLLGKHQMSCQTVGGVAGWYERRYYFDGYIDRYEDKPESIAAINKEAMVKAANELVASKRWALGGLGNASEKQLNELHAQLAELFK